MIAMKIGMKEDMGVADKMTVKFWNRTQKCAKTHLSAVYHGWKGIAQHA